MGEERTAQAPREAIDSGNAIGVPPRPSESDFAGGGRSSKIGWYALGTLLGAIASAISLLLWAFLRLAYCPGVAVGAKGKFLCQESAMFPLFLGFVVIVTPALVVYELHKIGSAAYPDAAFYARAFRVYRKSDEHRRHAHRSAIWLAVALVFYGVVWGLALYYWSFADVFGRVM